MRHPHRSPKRFHPARSYRGREVAAQRRLGIGSREIAIDILKHRYPQRMLGEGGGNVWDRPKWATLAHDRHWMTSADFYRVPLVDTGVKARSIYEDSPTFALVAKERNGRG